MGMTVINPATGEKIKSYDTLGKEEVIQKIERGEKAFQSWRKTSFKERMNLMKKAAEILRKEVNEYAPLITMEMGKPITQSLRCVV